VGEHAQAIKQRLSLFDLLPKVGGPALRPGRNHNVRCPLPDHDDPGPSCSISADGSLFNCHGCGRAGDIFTFWEAHHPGIDFQQMLVELGKLAGIEVQLSDRDGSAGRRAAARDVLTDAAELAQGWLWGDTHEAVEAQTYLASRGISKKTAERAKLGLVPGWSTLRDALRAKGHSTERMLSAGLLKKSDKTSDYFDVLHHCLVFPFIRGGRVVFLTGRAANGEPRKTGLVLEGADVEPQSIYWPGGRPSGGKVAVAFEGEMTVLTALQTELPGVHVLSTRGTSVDPDAFAREVEGFDQVVLMMDDDKAGRGARNKLALRLNGRARVASLKLSEGSDLNDRLQALLKEATPDGARAQLRAEFERALSGAKPYIEAVVDEVDAPDVTTAERATLIKELVVPALGALSPLDQEVYLPQVAARLKVSKNILRSSAKKEHASRAAANDEDGDGGPMLVEPYISAIEMRFMPLFVTRAEARTSLGLWSKARHEVVDVPLDNRPRAIAALAPDMGPLDVTSYFCSTVPGSKANKVEDTAMSALQALSARVRSRAGLTAISEGIHALPDGRVVAVDSNRAFVLEDGVWRRLDVPLVGDYYLNPHADAAPWLPWDEDVLNAPLAIEPKKAAELLRDIVAEAWAFEQEADAWLHALGPFALALSSVWPRKPLLHVMAPSNSGKSRLALGWYGGKVGMPGWVLARYIGTDISPAGAEARLRDSTILLIMDEFEGSEVDRRRFEDILRMLRAAMLGGSGTLRGTRARGWTEQKLDIPCLAVSIQPFDRTADANRWCPSRLVHDRGGRTPPERVVRAMLESYGTPAAEIQRVVNFALCSKVAELRAAYEMLSALKFPGLQSRFVENFLPVAAVAEVIGLGGERIMRELLSAHTDDHAEIEDEGEEQVLMRALLTSPFRFRDESRTAEAYETTVWSELKRKGRMGPINSPACGIWTKGDPGAENETLVVNWETALASILRNSQVGTWSVKRLVAVAKSSADFLGVERHVYRDPSGREDWQRRRVTHLSVRGLIDSRKQEKKAA